MDCASKGNEEGGEMLLRQRNEVPHEEMESLGVGSWATNIKD